MLVDSNNYINVLQKKASEVAPGRVKFRCPVSPEQIVKTLREYDVGLHVIPPTSFSYLHALPNKFFEAIMAGLAVIVGPSIEMATIVQRYQLGLVADNFEPLDVARVLNNLSSSQIDFMKKQSIKAASELNADQELARLLSMYAGLLQRP